MYYQFSFQLLALSAVLVKRKQPRIKCTLRLRKIILETNTFSEKHAEQQAFSRQAEC